MVRRRRWGHVENAGWAVTPGFKTVVEGASRQLGCSQSRLVSAILRREFGMLLDNESSRLAALVSMVDIPEAQIEGGPIKNSGWCAEPELRHAVAEKAKVEGISASWLVESTIKKSLGLEDVTVGR